MNQRTAEKRKGLFLILLCVSGIFFGGNAVAPTISFPNFNSVAGLQLLVDAKQVDTKLELTDTLFTNQYGAAWYLTRQPIVNGFETSFKFVITPAASASGDGFAFVIHNDTIDQTNVIGMSGENLGYGNGVNNGLAVEFDTWENANNSDPNNNHIGVICSNTSARMLFPSHSGNPEPVSPPYEIADKQEHTVKIVYNGNTLVVSLDEAPLVTANIGLDTILGPSAKGEAWIGFTAGTGLSREFHDILSWTFTPSPSSIRQYPIKNIGMDSKTWMDAIYVNKVIRISYFLPLSQYVVLKIYDSQGKNIISLNQGIRTSGIHNILLDGSSLASRIYYYQLISDNVNITKPMLLLR